MLLSRSPSEVTLAQVVVVQAIHSEIVPAFCCHILPRRWVPPQSTRSPFSYPRHAILLREEFSLFDTRESFCHVRPEIRCKTDCTNSRGAEAFYKWKLNIIQNIENGIPETSWVVLSVTA